MSRIVSSFNELKIVVAELQRRYNNAWAKHYLDQYIANIHNPESRLEYLYRLLQILRKYDIRIDMKLLEKLIEGKIL